MADSTVALLTAASALDGTELMYGAQGGADRKVTPAQIKTYVGTPGGAPTGSAGGDLTGTYPNPTLGFAAASAAAAAADADTFPTNQGAGTLKQTLAAVKTWIKAWIVKADVGLGNVLNSVQLVAASNLSDLANAATARTNLGLGTAATQTTGTFAQVANNLSDVASATTARNNLSAAPTRHSGYVSTRWYFPPGVGPASGGTNTTNTIVAFPFIAPAAVTITDLGIRVQTLQAAKLISLAIYAGNASTCRPTGNALSSTSSNISFASGGNASNALSANVPLTPGNLYWLAFNTDASTGICGGIGNAGPEIPGLIGGALADLWNGGSVVSITGVSVAQTFGTWPDLTAGSFTVLTSAAVPMIAFKAQ